MEKPVFCPGKDYAYNIIHRNENCNAHIPPHVHDGVELYLSLSPLPDMLLGNRVVSAEPGTLILIPPFCVHRLFDRTDEPYDRYILSLRAAWLDNLFPRENEQYSYLQDPEHPLLLFPPVPLLHTMQKTLDELLAFQGECSFSSIRCLMEFMSLVDCLVNLNDPANRKKLRISTTQQTVNEIIHYLDEHIGESVSLRDLSRQFTYNPDYISRIFKKHTNTTVSGYIMLRKMARARQLLSEGHTVTQVQLMTGYTSYAHFTRTFREQVGIPPGAYRNSHLNSVH